MGARRLFPALALALATLLFWSLSSRPALAQACPATGYVDILAVYDHATTAEVVLLGAWPTCGYTHYNIRWSGGGGQIQQEVPFGTSRSTLPAKLRGTVYTVSVQACRERFLASSVCGGWKARKFVTCGTKGLPCGHPRLNAPEPVRIVSGAGRCLDVHAPDQFNNGARVQVWACNGTGQQTWVIDREVGAVISLAGKCLDVHSPDQAKDGGRVQVWDCNRQPQQTWQAGVRRPPGATTRAIAAASGKCLDVYAPDQFKNGATVQVWSCNGTMQQDWRVETL